jgi:hypothetical protein
VRSQNLLARTDVPSDVSVGQRTIREWPDEQRPERNHKDEVANRGKKKTLPTHAGYAARSGSIRCPLICRNHEVCWRPRLLSAAVPLDVREASGYWKRGRARKKDREVKTVITLTAKPPETLLEMRDLEGNLIETSEEP